MFPDSGVTDVRGPHNFDTNLGDERPNSRKQWRDSPVGRKVAQMSPVEGALVASALAWHVCARVRVLDRLAQTWVPGVRSSRELDYLEVGQAPTVAGIPPRQLVLRLAEVSIARTSYSAPLDRGRQELASGCETNANGRGFDTRDPQVLSRRLPTEPASYGASLSGMR